MRLFYKLARHDKCHMQIMITHGLDKSFKGAEIIHAFIKLSHSLKIKFQVCGSAASVNRS